MNKAVIILLMLVAAAIVFVIVFGIPLIIEREKIIRGKKLYDSVQIGDKYIQKFNRSNPFERQWGGVITILDKKMNGEGIPYVKYVDYLGLECSANLMYLIENSDYVPYNNQDKKQ